MARDDEDIILSEALRSVTSPTDGNMMQASTGGIMPSTESTESAMIDSDGRVRRLWQPGDPWSNDFYFGGGE